MPAITFEVAMEDKDKKNEETDFTHDEIMALLSGGIDAIAKRYLGDPKYQDTKIPKREIPYISVA